MLFAQGHGHGVQKRQSGLVRLGATQHQGNQWYSHLLQWVVVHSLLYSKPEIPSAWNSPACKAFLFTYMKESNNGMCDWT